MTKPSTIHLLTLALCLSAQIFAAKQGLPPFVNWTCRGATARRHPDLQLFRSHYTIHERKRQKLAGFVLTETGSSSWTSGHADCVEVGLALLLFPSRPRSALVLQTVRWEARQGVTQKAGRKASREAYCDIEIINATRSRISKMIWKT